VSSSILAAVSSKAAACCSVRFDKSILPSEISLAAMPTDLATLCNWVTVVSML